MCASPEQDGQTPNAVGSGLGRHFYPVVRPSVEMHELPDVRWYEEERYGEQSILASPKLYSDKSKMSTKGICLIFYPFHVNVINCSERMQDLISSHGRTLCTLMIVSFFHI